MRGRRAALRAAPQLRSTNSCTLCHIAGVFWSVNADLLAHSDGFNIMSSDTRNIVYETKTPMTPLPIIKMVNTLLNNVTYENN